MSLTRTKRRRRLKNSEKNISDVTLNDFANSEKAGASQVIRKKVGFKALIEEVKSLTLSLETEANDDEENDAKNYKETSRKIRRKKSREDDMGRSVSSDDGTSEDMQYESDWLSAVYPLDMWFIIGEYIPPEDVGRFAAICSSTRAVVASPDFWLRLRRRYLGGARDSEKNNFALRAQVIRALRQSYPPLLVRPQIFIRSTAAGLGCSGRGSHIPGITGFRNHSVMERHINKAQSAIGHCRVLRFTGDHHSVLGAYCVQSWQEKRKGGWVFYIKLKQTSRSNDINVQHGAANLETNESSSVNDEGTPDCWMSRSIGEEAFGIDDQKKKIGDMWANSEDGCKVIEVTLDKEQLSNGHFGPCPQILGLSLVWACARQTSSTCASSNSRSLALLFGPPHLSPKAASSLLPRLSVGWKSCGGGWAEPVSEAEEISLACGTPLPKGAKCGVKRQSCCKGSGVGTTGVSKGFSYPEGMVPVVLPGAISVRLLDWWHTDYPFPGEFKNSGIACGEDEEDNGGWML